jgi:hypothetical protein
VILASVAAGARRQCAPAAPIWRLRPAALSGRLLRVVYVPDPQPDSHFVITAYELQGKAAMAYRRRRRRKR